MVTGVKRAALAACVAVLLPAVVGCGRKTVTDSNSAVTYTGERTLRRADTLSFAATLGITLKEPRIFVIHCSAGDTAFVEIRASELILDDAKTLVGNSETSDSVSVRTDWRSERSSRKSSGSAPWRVWWLPAVLAVLFIGLSLREIDSRR